MKPNQKSNAAIIAMALRRAEAMRKITDIAFPVSEHLVKCLLLPSSSHVRHWMIELSSWLDKAIILCNVKGGKRLTPKDISESLFFVDEPHILNARLRLIYRQYGLPKLSTDDLGVLCDDLIDVYRRLTPYIIDPEKMGNSDWDDILIQIMKDR